MKNQTSFRNVSVRNPINKISNFWIPAFAGMTMLFVLSQNVWASTLTVGSKDFPESYILAEIISAIAMDQGEAEVKKSLGMGGTGIIFTALEKGEIDIYPEYTGTLSQAILKDPSLRDWDSLNRALNKRGLIITPPLGFNNNYSLAVKEDSAKKIDYLGVIVARKEFQKKYPKTWESLLKLEGNISNSLMIRLNEYAESNEKTFGEIAALFRASQKWSLLEERRSSFVEPKKNTDDLGPERGYEKPMEKLWRLTREHIVLVSLSLFAAILVGLPLGMFSYANRLSGQFVLTFIGVIQTIPSLALLCFFIPFLGIGLVPALVALFLYSLLPIIRSTYAGFKSIEPRYIETAQAMGLSQLQILTRIQLPMASVHIMSGINTSAVINVGTATLAALIGAGGYGTLILTGLSLNHAPTILKGALPAAMLAFLVHWFIEFIEWLVVPKGLQS